MAVVLHRDQPFTNGVLHLASPWRGALALRWARPEERPTAVRFDGAALPEPEGPEGDLRLPALAGTLTWREGGELRRVRLDVAPDDRPDAPERSLLRAWADLVAELAPAGARGDRLDAAGALPTLAIEALLAAFKRTPLDELLERRGLGVLARVAARPRSWLRQEDEVVDIGRVRRPARDAVRHLDRHAHDVWYDGRKPYPGRLLGAFVEEELDIYENRVVVSLVTALRDRAARRLARLRHARARVDELLRSLERMTRLGQHRRRRALLARSGEGLDLGGVLQQAHALEVALGRQVRSLTAAASTPLVLALRHQSSVTSPLRETNILLFDPDYQVLVEVWRALEEERRAEERPDPRLDDPDAVYADFLIVALAHSLAELGFQALDGATPLDLHAGGGRGRLDATWRGAGWSVRLRRLAPEGPVELDIDPQVPEAAKPPPKAPRPASREERRRRTHRGGSAAPGSVLDVAPPPGPPPLPSARLRLQPTFTPQQGARPAPDEARISVWVHPVDLLAQGAEVRVGVARDRLDLGASPRARHRHAVDPMKEAVLAFAATPWQHESLDRLGRLLRRFTTWPELAQGHLPERCPACHGPSRPDGDRGDRACADPECGARWGLRTCASCGAPIPKLLPARPPSEALEDLWLEHGSPGARWRLAADLGGRDLLADLCLHHEGMGGDMLVCPGCGDCGRDPCEADDGCGREFSQSS